MANPIRKTRWVRKTERQQVMLLGTPHTYTTWPIDSIETLCNEGLLEALEDTGFKDVENVARVRGHFQEAPKGDVGICACGGIMLPGEHYDYYEDISEVLAKQLLTAKSYKKSKEHGDKHDTCLYIPGHLWIEAEYA